MRARDNVLAVLGAAVQPPLQFPYARRQDEDTDEIVARLFAQLLRALPVDVEQDIAARLASLEHRQPRRAVAMAENFGPFQQVARFHHGGEAAGIDEVIIAAVDFAAPFRPRGHRYGKLDVAVRAQQQAG